MQVDDKLKEDNNEVQDLALLQRVAKKQFYFVALALLAVFMVFIVPNYNGGENLYPIIIVAVSFCVLLGFYANQLFARFSGKKRD